MAAPSTSLAMTTFAVNSINLLEQLQSIDIDAANTLVDGRGIADRYTLDQVTKQKQTVDFTCHWYNNSTSLEATNLDITVWSIGGTAYVGALKSGTFDLMNSGPEVSAINALTEYPLPTNTKTTITSDIMVVTTAALESIMLGSSLTAMAVTVLITFAGESISVPAIMSASKHSVKRGEVQMENVSFSLQGTPTTPGDTTSLIYLALIGAGVTSFDAVTGTNEYKTNTGKFAMISKLNMRFADKALIEQSITLELQGSMVVA